jgi:TRAP-type C4-dicarboxylate transport system substrate-binding protein
MGKTVMAARSTFSFAVAAALAATLVFSSHGNAAEVTLRAVSAFPLNTQFGKPFKTFVDEVNKRGKGIVKINLLGGPETMPPAESANAVRNGVVDIAWTPPNYYANLLPEASAMAFGNLAPSELHKNGGWAFLEELHAKKVNAYLLSAFGWGIKHHLYLVKPVKSLADLKGLKIRPAPGMQDFFAALGASNVSMMPGEVYTGLERHVIDGYSWPLWGVNDLGWNRVTKQRIDPGYGGVQVNALVNLNTWNKLSDAQRKFLSDMAAWFDDYAAKTIAATNAAEAKKQAASGIQVLKLSDAEAKHMTDTFSTVMWQTIKKEAPQDADKLKSYLVQ